MIKSISAKNFLSWENLSFNVSSGVTLIDGWNDDDQTSEGSGKSAVLNAVSWCLYGKLPKDAKIDEVIRDGQKSCKVSVVLDSGDLVVRSRGPNDLYLQRDGSKIKGSTANETQKLIEEYVGLSFDAFCQVHYFAQNYDKKFLQSNQEDKSKILSEIQDLNLFDKARKEAHELLKKEEASLKDITHQIELEKKELNSIDLQIQSEEALIAQAINHYESKVSDKMMEVKNLESRLSEAVSKHKIKETELVSLQSIVDTRPELSQQISDLMNVDVSDLDRDLDVLKEELQKEKLKMSQIDSLKSERQRKIAEGQRYAKKYEALNQQNQKLQSDIEKTNEFINNPTKDCPTCGSRLENCDTSHAQIEISRLQKSINENAEEMQTIIQFLTALDGETSETIPSIEDNRLNSLQAAIQKTTSAKLDRINQNKSLIYDLNLQKTQIETSINRKSILESELNSLHSNVQYESSKFSKASEELEILKTNRPKFDKSKIESLKIKKSELSQKVNSIDSILIEKQRYIQQLSQLKDGFKEVKSFIFNSVLNEINVRTNKYLQKLFEVPVSLKFTNDDMKIQTDIRLNGEERSLGLLSGGQSRRLGLAVDLALSDVVSSRKGSKIGLLILDEYFKDLSEQSMDKCLQLLETRGQPVLLVEHNSIFKNIVNNTFFVKYQNKVSRHEI